MGESIWLGSVPVHDCIQGLKKGRKQVAVIFSAWQQLVR